MAYKRRSTEIRNLGKKCVNLNAELKAIHIWNTELTHDLCRDKGRFYEMKIKLRNLVKSFRL